MRKVIDERACSAVSPLDPATYVFVSALLVAAAMLAASMAGSSRSASNSR